MSSKTVYLILLCALLLTTGQVFWKHGLDKMGGFNPSIGSIWGKLLILCSSPYIVVGSLIYVAATLLWLNVISNAPLSIAYPLMSVSYVLGVIAARLVFGEAVPMTRWFGVGVVCIGIYFISR